MVALVVITQSQLNRGRHSLDIPVGPAENRRMRAIRGMRSPSANCWSSFLLLVLQFSDKFSPLISALICEPAFQVIFGRCQDFLILSVHWPSREAAKPCLFNPGFWGSKQFLGEKRFWANLIGAVAGKSGGRGEAKSCLPNLSTTRNRKNLSLETNRKREPENQTTKLLKLETRNRKTLSLETNRQREPENWNLKTRNQK